MAPAAEKLAKAVQGRGQVGQSRAHKLLSRCLSPLIVLLVLFGELATPVTAVWREDAVLRPDSVQPCALRDELMDPTYEVRNGHRFVWQIPPNPRAIIMFFHGEDQDELRFFDPGPRCPRCYGMPENRRAVLDALRWGFAAIAIKSIGVTWDRWPLDPSADEVMITDVMDYWKREHSLEDLPLVGWGHSAGGFFLSALPFFVPFQALVLMCSEGEEKAIDLADPHRFPPTFFAYMNYDGDYGFTTVETVEQNMAILLARGVSVSAKRFSSRPLTEEYFTERIRCMTDDMTRKVISAFAKEGWLDKDGFLVRDPEFEDWRAVLWKWKSMPYCIADQDLCLALHVEQEINVAHGTHTFWSDGDEEIFSWMTSVLWPPALAADPRLTSASE